jgi:hypothetical protein
VQPLTTVSHHEELWRVHGKGTRSNQAETPPQIWQSERLHSRYNGEAETA